MTAGEALQACKTLGGFGPGEGLGPFNLKLYQARRDRDDCSSVRPFYRPAGGWASVSGGRVHPFALEGLTTSNCSRLHLFLVLSCLVRPMAAETKSALMS